MNLWVKRIGQLLVVLTVALFFFGCEDETSLLGYKNPNSKFDVRYVEIPIGSSSLLIDSVITDIYQPSPGSSIPRGSGSILLGQYEDPLLGKVVAKSFIQFYPLSTTVLATTSVYDSVVLQVRLNYYSYNLDGTRQESFSVHEITGDTLTLYNNRYYYHSSIAYSEESLGEGKFEVKYDTLKKYAALQANQQKELLATAKLNDNFGARLFAVAKDNPSSKLTDFKEFKQEFKGLALVPAESDAVIGFNPLHTSTSVVLHYHTLNDDGSVKDTLSNSFGFNFPTFTNITTDRSTSELAGLMPYQSVALPGGNRYLQNGSPVIARLDFTNFYTQFADTIQNLAINSAELVIENVESSTKVSPHGSFVFQVMKNDKDQFAYWKEKPDSVLIGGLRVFSDGSYYYPFSDRYVGGTPTPATLNFVSDKNMYTASLSTFLQSMFRNKGKENRLLYLGLFPGSPRISESVNRTVFNANNVRLKIFYTKPTANP